MFGGLTICCIFESTNKQTTIMKANEIINYAAKTGMNIEFNSGEYGQKIIGIEWKNNYVWYWFMELMDGDMLFIERFSMRNGTSKTGYNRTAINIEKKITESF